MLGALYGNVSLTRSSMSSAAEHAIRILPLAASHRSPLRKKYILEGFRIPGDAGFHTLQV
jgi:hypothetical protein